MELKKKNRIFTQINLIKQYIVEFLKLMQNPPWVHSRSTKFCSSIKKYNEFSIEKINKTTKPTLVNVCEVTQNSRITIKNFPNQQRFKIRGWGYAIMYALWPGDRQANVSALSSTRSPKY